jgi:hypothetical protein
MLQALHIERVSGFGVDHVPTLFERQCGHCGAVAKHASINEIASAADARVFTASMVASHCSPRVTQRLRKAVHYRRASIPGATFNFTLIMRLSKC